MMADHKRDRGAKDEKNEDFSKCLHLVVVEL